MSQKPGVNVNNTSSINKNCMGQMTFLLTGVLLMVYADIKYLVLESLDRCYFQITIFDIQSRKNQSNKRILCSLSPCIQYLPLLSCFALKSNAMVLRTSSKWRAKAPIKQGAQVIVKYRCNGAHLWLDSWTQFF